MKKCLISILLLVVCAVATEIFTDDFSTGSWEDKWALGFPGEGISVSQASGALRIENSSQYFNLVSRSRDVSELSELSFKADVATSDTTPNFIGICVGLQLNTVGTGYLLSVEKLPGANAPSFSIYKLVNSGTSLSSEIVLFQSHSAVRVGNNSLEISRKDKTINFIINGQSVHVLQNTEVENGAVALVANSKTTVSFDNVVITDSYKATPPLQYFSTSFGSQGLTGFTTALVDTTGNNANVQFSITPQGALRAIAIDNVQLFVQGDFTSYDSVFLEIAYEQGSETSLYGINLMEITYVQEQNQVSSNYDQQAKFLINKSRQYTAAATSAFIPNNATDKINANTQKNRLTVKKGGAFYANGYLLDSLESEGFAYNAIGILIQKGVTVDLFSFGGGLADKMTPVAKPFISQERPLHTAITQRSVHAGSYSLLGRRGSTQRMSAYLPVVQIGQKGHGSRMIIQRLQH